MNVFGIGLPEMALILVIALLVFGPKKLPEVGRSLAQALNSFKKAQQEFESEIKKEADELKKSVDAPMKASIERPEPKALSPQKQEEPTDHEVDVDAVEAEHPDEEYPDEDMSSQDKAVAQAEENQVA